MNWIKISEKIPPAHKRKIGIIRGSNDNQRPVIFCRRYTKKDAVYQDNHTLELHDIEYWCDYPKGEK